MVCHSNDALVNNVRLQELQVLQEKGLQSRSAFASLLIKIYQCMKEEITLIVFLAQKSRHIVEACGRKEGRITSLESDHVWTSEVKKGRVARLVKSTSCMMHLNHKLGNANSKQGTSLKV